MDTYNPEEAVPLVGMSASTIRNWCKQYAVGLSPSANPASGLERRLTTQDVATLQRIKAWRDDRLPPNEIVTLLQAATTRDEATALTIEVEPTPSPSAQETHSGDLLLPVALSSIAGRQDAADERMDRLQQAITTLQREQVAHSNALYTGLVLGGAFVLIVVAVALWLGG